MSPRNNTARSIVTDTVRPARCPIALLQMAASGAKDVTDSTAM
jgi:hypothetical protein